MNHGSLIYSLWNQNPGRSCETIVIITPYLHKRYDLSPREFVLVLLQESSLFVFLPQPRVSTIRVNVKG